MTDTKVEAMRLRWESAAGRVRSIQLPRAVRNPGILLGLALIYALPMLDVPFLDTPSSDFASVLFYPTGIFVLLAVGLHISYGLAGQLNLGYAGFAAVGAYTMGVLGTSYGLPYPVVVPLSGLVAFAVALVLGVPALRLRGDYLAVVTLGFGMIAQLVVNNINAFGGPRGITGIPNPPSIGPLEFGLIDPTPYYWLLITLVVVAVWVVGRLRRSRMGRGWIAIRDDERAAEQIGVPVFWFMLLAFACSATVGAVAGTTYATKVSYISPENYGVLLSIMVLAALIVGGAGSLRGAVIGAVIVAYIPEYLRSISDYRDLAFGLALVLLMIWRPGGVGAREKATGPSVEDEDEEDPARSARDSDEAEDRRGTPKTMVLPDREPLFSVRGVSKTFGGVAAVRDLSFEVGDGSIVGLIGPNGAGKTTVFNLITGVYQPDQGSIQMDGQSLVSVKPHVIVRRGVARTFQHIRLFESLTVLDNVLVGCDVKTRSGIPGAILRPPRFRLEDRTARATARSALEAVGLSDRAHDKAGTLPYGLQRRLEIARAMATGARLLLLDEPAAGCNPAERRQLMTLVRHIRDLGYAVMLIEHDMQLVMGICDKVVVLNFGTKLAQGTPAEVRANEDVIAAYLGASRAT